eukprot:4103441-Pleurochrysis_carterae.AAC.2
MLPCLAHTSTAASAIVHRTHLFALLNSLLHGHFLTAVLLFLCSGADSDPKGGGAGARSGSRS